MSSKNQITLPVATMRAAGLHAGDEVTVRPIGDGEAVAAARDARIKRHAGIATGIYCAAELDRPRRVGPLILDASVLIGLLDTADAHHSRAIEDTEAADRMGRPCWPRQRLQRGARRLREPTASTTPADSTAAMGITVAPLTPSMAEHAAELRAGHERLRLPDAIVLACARQLDGELLTYDQRLAQLNSG